MQITVNGEPLDVPGPITVAALLARLGMDGKPVAVEVNRRLVPRAEHVRCSLAAGDTLEIVTLVGGG
jgi:thiamine biosynthesis protein ThiS